MFYKSSQTCSYYSNSFSYSLQVLFFVDFPYKPYHFNTFFIAYLYGIKTGVPKLYPRRYFAKSCDTSQLFKEVRVIKIGYTRVANSRFPLHHDYIITILVMISHINFYCSIILSIDVLSYLFPTLSNSLQACSEFPFSLDSYLVHHLVHFEQDNEQDNFLRIILLISA